VGSHVYGLARFDGHPAVELIHATAPRPRVVFTCEHASNHLPAPWSWTPGDAHLPAQHWGYDLGIADLTRRLAARLGAPAVLGRFSRLLIDANRPLDSDTLFRSHADGRAIELNTAMSAEDRQRRIEQYWRPYHEAADALVAATPGACVIGMHSFTPLYEGSPRAVEIGVLFDHDEPFAERWLAWLRASCGLQVELNEPWSGRAGLMFGPQGHATRHGRLALELEVRQDLATDAHRVDELVDLFARACDALT
jgi:predicted N-formylglutamate amidohydrolase